MSLTSDYRRRIVDDELDEYLADLPAVGLDGPKGVGKTATALQRAATVFALDNPDTVEIVTADPGRVVRSAEPVLVDEWQRYPPSWDMVRRAVDADARPGRFLLTGSASPATPGTHSGAGRIVSLRMRPLSLAERSLATPTVSLSALLRGGPRGVRIPIAGATSMELTGYVDQIVAGGFPGIRAQRSRTRRAAFRSYTERIVDRDVPEAGVAPRNPALLRRWLTAYAAATATTSSYEALRDASTAGTSDKPAKSTTTPYQDALERIWISDPLPAWTPTHNHLHRLTFSPKHHLADPALAVALTDLEPADLLDGRRPGIPLASDGTFLGALFESLVTLSVRVYAQAAEARVRHLRTKGGEREVDLIVVAPGGKVVAIEVKLARTASDHDVRHLLWLRDRLGPGLADAVVVTTGPEAYRRADGVAVVPAALMGP